ncbi:PLP-dependent transferase [Martensiomyces pterosporus]|nr:PLP-dependent transferase [Martensiomyces pterosporus]
MVASTNSPQLPEPKDIRDLFVPSMRGPQKSAFKSVMGSPTLAMINMAGGVPHPSTFPLHQLQATVKPSPSRPSSSNADNTLVLEKSRKSRSVESLDELLQYGDGCGLDSYRSFLREHTRRTHSPKYAGWDVIASCGNTDSINKAVSLFCEPGDAILVERWTFPGALSGLAAAKVRPVPVEIDGEGMVPESLDSICSSWHGARPLRAAYVIPTGQNPTGATMSLARRKSIYAVAQKHNLAIIEDDPYYFLQFPPLRASTTSGSGSGSHGSPHLDSGVQSGEQLWELVPSLLSLDVDGRVIRLDSFSKILAPNLRCGWITAPTYILDKLQILNETTILQPSGLSQGVISKLLNDTWGVDGWDAHLRDLRAAYTIRRDAFVGMVEKHLSGLVEYTVPTAGMFLWMSVDLGSAASDPTAMMRLLENMKRCGVMMAPGMPFNTAPPASSPSKPENYLRAAFALVDIDMFEPALARLAQAITAIRNGQATTSPAASASKALADEAGTSREAAAANASSS